jgi:hypothetical protein
MCAPLMLLRSLKETAFPPKGRIFPARNYPVFLVLSSSRSHLGEALVPIVKLCGENQAENRSFGG